MLIKLDADILQDELAIQTACAVAIANRVAREEGYEPTHHLLWVRQEIENGVNVWQVDYVPNKGVNHRGGGFTVEIDAQDGHIIKTLRGQ